MELGAAQPIEPDQADGRQWIALPKLVELDAAAGGHNQFDSQQPS